MRKGVGIGVARRRRLSGGGGGLTLRQQIDGLRDGTTPNGRQSSATLKVIGVDTLPTGMAIVGTVVNNNSYAGALEDWDFRGYNLAVKTAMGAIRNCIFGETSVTGIIYYLDFYTTGSATVVEYNTFTGPFTFGGAGTAINQRLTGTGQSVTAGSAKSIRYNRFTGMGSDCIKSAGDLDAAGQIIEWNYFGPPVNLPDFPVAYNALTVYAIGDLVITGAGYVFRSLQNGNVGNTPPASKTDNAFWDNLDPHADAITTVLSINKTTIRRNLFDWTDDPIGPDGPYPGIGRNNAFRLSRNTGVDYRYDDVLVEENVSYHGAFESYPIQVSEGVATNFDGPISFIGNWIGANDNGLYFHPTTDGWVDVWTNNRDAITDALIDAPTLRMSTMVVAFMSQSEGAYISESSAFYRALTPPALNAENLTIYQRNGAGTGADTSTTKTALTSGNRLTVNPSMVVLSNALDYIFPGDQFVFVELSETGTGRTGWVDDANSDRIWARSADMVAEAVADYGYISRVCEFWWANDATAMPNWLANMAAIYYGENPDGTAFTLGNTRSTATIDTSAIVDHCLWDFESSGPTDIGRGLFKRTTPLDIVRKGSWGETNDARFAGVQAFVDDSRFVALGGKYGPPGFSWYSDGHPVVTEPFGQYEAMFDFVFPSFLRAKGIDVTEARFTGITSQSDGSYCEIEITPQNGGVLSTKRRVHGVADPVSPTGYWQEIFGFEIRRAGDAADQRFLVMRPGTSGIDAKYQGTVTLVGGKARITMVNPIADGDDFTYLMGAGYCRTGGSYVYVDQGTLTVDMLTIDMAVENVAAYTDATADHPFSGFPIRTRDGSFTVTGVGVPATAPVVTVLSQTNNTTGAASYESASFTPSGVPLIVVIFTVAEAAGAETLDSVTIGTAGRTLGTGTTMTVDDTDNGSRNNIFVYSIASPGTSAVTIQVDNTLANRACSIVVLEATGANVADIIGATNGFGTTSGTSTSPTVTTLSNASTVVHLHSRAYRAEVDGLTGATNLLTGSTGGASASFDSEYLIATEDAPTAGVYDCAVTWITSSARVGLSIEVKS